MYSNAVLLQISIFLMQRITSTGEQQVCGSITLLQIGDRKQAYPGL